MSQSLRALSDENILSRTLELTRRERSATLQVLLHLNEIERRQLHLRQGYSSMFDYCTAGLGYSTPAAVRRIQTARCVARFPEVHALLEVNEVSLSTVSHVSRILGPGNKDALLARIRGKSYRDVKAIASSYDPRAAVPDRVQPIAILVQASAGRPAISTPPAAITTASQACEKSDYIRRGCAPDTTAARPACSGVEDVAAIVEIREVFTFSASEAFKKKFDRVRSLAAHRLRLDSLYEQVFELGLDLFLEKNDPAARQERREERSRKVQEQRKRPNSLSGARHVPAHVRDQVFLRDQGRCTYPGPGGRQCGSTHVLQVDHIMPVARGGASTSGNLRLLCAYHNRLEAERLMGVAHASRGAVRESPPLRR